MSFVKKPLANTILAVLSNLALKVNKSCSWGALFSLPLKRAESKVWGLPISLYIISGFSVCLSRIQYDCNVVFANRASPKIFWEGHITPEVFCACLFDAGVCSADTQLTIILELALFWYPRNVGYWKCTQRQRPLPFGRFYEYFLLFIVPQKQCGFGPICSGHFNLKFKTTNALFSVQMWLLMSFRGLLMPVEQVFDKRIAN